MSTQAQQVPVSRYLLYSLVTIFGCAADLLSKYWVFQWRGMPRARNEWWIIEGYIGIETSLNPGALFGLGKGYGLIFAGLSVLAIAGICYWLFVRKAGNDLLLTFTLSLVSGGIIGNLYDRLGLWKSPDGIWHSEVRDWILFRWGEHTWPNFNIADSLLVIGAMLLVFHAFTTPDPTADPTPPKK
ncbi:MAG: signal peptidase II [Pirellulaceae bacterium]|jgi:signal peptidase II